MAKVVVRCKDPDALYESVEGEDERDAACDKYTEFGEYFRFEVDFATGEARLLPKAEWPRR